jgi:hypothetical protein
MRSPGGGNSRSKSRVRLRLRASGSMRNRIRAAPAAITPRHIPARIAGQRARHEIETGGAERMAAGEPGRGHPATGPQAESADRLLGIFGAGRQVPAVPAEERRKRVVVGFDQPASGDARGADHGMEQRPHAAIPRPPQPGDWPRSGRSRKPPHRRSAGWRRGAPCSRAPARARRRRPICLAAARRSP